MNIILSIKIKNYVKTIINLIKILVIALILISAFILLKYKPTYEVSLAGQKIGYVSDKDEFKKIVDKDILNPNNENIAYVDIEEMPKYHLIFTNKNAETTEDQVFTKIQEVAVVTYKLYAVTLDNENVAYAYTQEEAQNTVNEIKENKAKELKDMSIAVKEFYTQDINSTESLQVASNDYMAQSNIAEKIEKQIEIKSSTFDGVYFSVKPVTGTITSRFGATEDIRDHAHKGIDIAAPNGTPIKAAADGKVTFSGTMGGYGNLIIITHENGVQTYYGHCSKLCVSVGDEITAGDIIGKVGSTGQSTGNHLHFEIRKNGSQINPQSYLYK